MDCILFNGCKVLVLLFVLVLTLSLFWSFPEGIIGTGLALPLQPTKT